MKERPILFNGDMVRAVMDGRKTQTRRVIKGVGPDNWLKGASNHVVHAIDHCPMGKIGDVLWVKENFKVGKCANNLKPSELDARTWIVENGGVWYLADNHCPLTPISTKGKTRPNNHMPKWASRIKLEITDLRVEFLNDISSDDAKAEGIEYFDSMEFKGYKNYLGPGFTQDPVRSFESLWESINGKDSWLENPWVWVIEFEVIQ